MTDREIIKKIEDAFQKLFSISGQRSSQLLPQKKLMGKIYEAYVLSDFCEELKHREYQLSLKKGNKLTLKFSPGPINRNYPWILAKKDRTSFEIFTDVEFLGLSYTISHKSKKTNKLEPGHYHELDIAVIRKAVKNGERPLYNKIQIAIECKNTAYKKSFLRETLGIRLELGFYNPPSHLCVYSTSPAVKKYKAVPGEAFGINFIHKVP